MKIIILHGWGQDKSYWHDFKEKLSALLPDYKTESLDLPGFGNEPLVSEDWSVPDYADWVSSRLANEKNIILVGHSFGGRIAAYIASQNPEWLQKIILIGAPLLRRPSLKLKLRIAIYKILKNLLPAKIKQKFYAEELKDAHQKSLGKIFRNVVEFDQTEILPLIQKPTLLIWGEKDKSVSIEIAKEAASLIKDSQLIILPGVGHNVHLEAANLLAGKIKSYLQTYTNETT